MTQSVHQNPAIKRKFVPWQEALEAHPTGLVGRSGILGYTEAVKTLRSMPTTALTPNQRAFLDNHNANQGNSRRFKVFSGVVGGIVAIATGGAAYSALAGSAALSGGAAAGGAGGSGLGGASGAVGTTAAAAGGGLGGGVAVISPTVAVTASTTAGAVASGAKAWTLTGAVKQYGGAALMLLSGSSKPATPDEANRTLPFNDANLFADYAYGYGSGGGMGGGPMLTSGGEPVGIFDEIISSPWLLVITGGLILLLGYFFIRK